MTSIIVKLRNYSKSASLSEQQIIQYILSSPHNAIDLSVHELAKHTYTSSASVTRLAKKLGFSGFRDFKNSLIAEVTIKDYTKVTQTKEIAKSESTNNISDKILTKYIATLEETRSLLDYHTLECIIEKIKNARNIYLFGIGSSFLVAKDFQQKMLRLGKVCIISEDYHMQRLQSQTITSEDLAIVFSYSGQTHEVIQCCENIKNAGCELISITSFSNSPIAKLSDQVLYIANDENLERSGAVTSRISQLYTVDVLYMAYVSHEYENSLYSISKTQLPKAEMED